MREYCYELRHVGVVYPSGESKDRREGIYIDDLRIPASGVTAIVGASGSGKTSLLNLLAGFALPSPETVTLSSRLVYNARDGSGISLLKRGSRLPRGEIGFIFQESYLLKNAPVGLNVALSRIRTNEITSRWLHGCLRDGNLGEDFARRRSRLLSGGQAQRVAFSRALAAGPSVVLADEPTSNLDDDNSAELMTLLRDRAASNSKAVIWITHHIEQAAKYADNVVVLAKGRTLLGETWPTKLPSLPPSESPRNELPVLFEIAAKKRTRKLYEWRSRAEAQKDLTLQDIEKINRNERSSAERRTVRTPGTAAQQDAAPPRRIIVWEEKRPPQERRPATRIATGQKASKAKEYPLKRALREIGFISRLALSELFSHPRVDQVHPAAGVVGWSTYDAAGSPAGAGLLASSWRFLFSFSRFGLMAVTLLVLLVILIGLKSLRVIDAYFEQQLNAPEVSHVVLGFHNPSAAKRLKLTPEYCANLEESLSEAIGAKGGAGKVDVSGRRTDYKRYRITSLPPDGKSCSLATSAKRFDMLIADIDEKLFQSMRVMFPREAGGNTPRRPLREVIAAMGKGHDPVVDVVVTPRVLDAVLPNQSNNKPTSYFCLLDTFPRKARIIGVVDRLPGSDDHPFELLIDEQNYVEAHYQKRHSSELPVFQQIAVYFPYSHFTEIRNELEKIPGMLIPTDVFDKLESLLELSRTSERLLLGAISLVLVLAGSALILFVSGYIERNERSFFVMRAFGHPWASLFLLLALQMAFVTCIVTLLFAVLWFAIDPYVAEPLASTFGMQKEAFAFSLRALGITAAGVFSIQLVVCLFVSSIWWYRNRYIARRMQAL